jgi:hypothetical protein
LDRNFWGWLRGSWYFWSWFWGTGNWFLVCLHLGFNVALSGFLFLLLLFIISEGLFNAS